MLTTFHPSSRYGNTASELLSLLNPVHPPPWIYSSVGLGAVPGAGIAPFATWYTSSFKSTLLAVRYVTFGVTQYDVRRPDNSAAQPTFAGSCDTWACAEEDANPTSITNAPTMLIGFIPTPHTVRFTSSRLYAPAAASAIPQGG